MCRIIDVRYNCGCPYYPQLVLPDLCDTNCGQLLGPNTMRFASEPCGRHSVIPYDPQSVEAFVRAEHKLPRFLFRGFHGANMATRRGLNTQTGVYPFAYPPAQSNATYRSRNGFEAEVGIPGTVEPAHVRLHRRNFHEHMQLAENHVQFNTASTEPTSFTSWTADFTTALWFGSGSYVGERAHTNVLSQTEGYICILDTNAFLPNGLRGERIIHAPDLGCTSLPFEYFIHGPVYGPAFRCVRMADIRRILDCNHFPFCLQPYGAPPAPAAPAPAAPGRPALAPAPAPAPAVPAGMEAFAHLFARAHPEPEAPAPAPAPAAGHHVPTHNEVSYAVRVGALFQRPGDRTIDITLVVAAFMLARTQISITPSTATPVEVRWLVDNLCVVGPGAPIDLTVDGGVIQAIATHLFPVGLPLPLLSDIRIVHNNMDTVAQPQLQWVRNLLLRLDIFWRSLTSALLAPTPDEWTTALMLLRGPRHQCPPDPPGASTTPYTAPRRRVEPMPYRPQ